MQWSCGGANPCLSLKPTQKGGSVHNHIFHTYRFLYTEGISMVLPVSSRIPWSSPCVPRLDFPNLLFSDQFYYDMAEFTLCYGLYDCSLSFEDFIHPINTLHYCNAPKSKTVAADSIYRFFLSII